MHFEIRSIIQAAVYRISHNDKCGRAFSVEAKLEALWLMLI